MQSAITKSLLAKFENLQVWRAGDQRAPQRALLALWAIGRCLAGEPRLAPYEEADRALRVLLGDFGPHRARPRTERPFWRLRNDTLWEVEHEGLVTTTRKGDPHRRSLLENDIHAGFPRAVHEALTADKHLTKQIAHALVDAHFPASLHTEILNAAGIEAAYVTTRRQPRDPHFSDRVLEAYGQRCAVCGFPVRLDEKSFGLGAAHIKWHGARGPDVVPNALSLCALHHRLFDRGAFTLSPWRQVVVSEGVTGAAERGLGRFHARPIALPAGPSDAPDPVFAGWHAREVFVSPGYLLVEP